MKLIGICGKAQSGKDTLAGYLCSQYGFARIAYADPLKMAAQDMFGLTHDQTWKDELKEVVIPYWNKTPRQIFQLLGTEASKPVFGDDIWTKRWYLSYMQASQPVVVTDVRFDVEYQQIKSLGGVILKVVRGQGLQGVEGQHASEKGVSFPADFTLVNDGSKQDLFDKLDLVMP